MRVLGATLPLIYAGLLVARPAAQAPTVGIGVQINAERCGGRVASVNPGGPAERGGIVAGDCIVAVDGVSVANADIDTIVAKVRGVSGTTARLTVASASGQQRQIAVVRAVPIPVPAPVSSQAQTGAGLGNITFVKWVEPKEHSFSVEVPAGWQLDGGLNWITHIDVQGYMRVQSPDGKVQAFLGDPELLARQVPSYLSRLQNSAGDGQIFQTPTGGRAKMERFLTGTEYAKEHISWRLCRNPTWVGQHDFPDAARAMAAALEPEGRKFNTAMTVSSGATSYTCGAAQGVVDATTVLGTSRNGPLQGWFVFKLAGFQSADPMRSMQARYVMEHMLATVIPNEAWTAAVEQRVQQVTGAFMSMQNASVQAQLAASRQQNDTLARLNHPNQGVSSRSSGSSSSVNSILGTKTVCDAMDRCANVSNDSNNMFMDHNGNVRSGPAGGGPPDNSGVWSPVYVR